jgi:hypothetical protein
MADGSCELLLGIDRRVVWNFRMQIRRSGQLEAGVSLATDVLRM